MTVREINLSTGEVTERPYTSEELAALVIPEPTPAEKLAKLEAENAISQRALRETILLMAEGFKLATGGALDLYTLPGVQDVARVEAEAAALRAEL